MLPTPFTNMAVSLSGGGYRATTFHLGALSYLHETPHDGHSLLKHVKIVSTISGGTLTGVMYALKMAQGEGFTGCYEKLYKLLEEDKLVDQALHKLNNPSKWKNKHKTRDIINAFSEVYNEEFFDEATFADLYNGPKTHLKEAIFGASEFTDGIQFRFQEKGKFGNYYLNINKAANQEIRLADAAAASSCFPGGFEPMIMPNDFSNGPNSTLAKTWNGDEKQYPETAIMDGGVIDNQGIEGVKLAEQRHGKNGEPYIGTYIVSDVSGEFMRPYEVPKFKYNGFKNFFSLNTINSIVAMLLLVIGGLLLFVDLPTWGIILVASFLPLVLIWFILYFNIKSLLKGTISNAFGPDEMPEIFKDFKVLLRTPIYIVVYLLKFRATSVLKMVTDIFLKRIRRLQLSSLYDSPEWNYRFKSNYIYTLEKDETLSKLMQSIIKSANDMPTTLWFTEKQLKNKQLDNLIACGQFTLCYNLIEYIQRLRDDTGLDSVWSGLKDVEKDKINKLQEHMKADWEKFKIEPYWLVNKFKEKSKAFA